MQLGRFEEAASLLEDAVATAELVGERALAANAGSLQLLVRLLTGETDGWSEQATAVANDGDHALRGGGRPRRGSARAWRVLAWINGRACRYGAAADGIRAGDRARAPCRRRAPGAARVCAVRAGGGLRPDAGRRGHPPLRGDRRARRGRPAGGGASSSACSGSSRRCAGNFDRARELYGQALGDVRGARLPVDAATVSFSSGRVELLAGDAAAAERELRRGYDYFSRLGERYLLSSVAGLLAEAVARTGTLRRSRGAVSGDRGARGRGRRRGAGALAVDAGEGARLSRRARRGRGPRARGGRVARADRRRPQPGERARMPRLGAATRRR